MSRYTGEYHPAQPIRDNFRNILLQIVANAEQPAEQKEMILILLENGLISCAECFALIHVYGLENT